VVRTVCFWWYHLFVRAVVNGKGADSKKDVVVVVEGRWVGERSEGRRYSKVVAGYCARAEERGIARTAANKCLHVTTTGGGSRVPWRDVLPSLHFTCESWGEVWKGLHW
jgi:hypothetical protein